MNWLKKFWITFLSFLPISAGAFWPFAIAGLGLGGGIIGYSIYRTASPVSITDALSFFSTCWSCQLFSDVVGEMSRILPETYHELGKIIIPFSLALTALWVAWTVLKPYITPKDGKFDGWKMGGVFGTHIIKVLFVCALLAAPLPRIISSVVIEPIFDIGLSMNYTISELDSRDNYAHCIIATAIADSQSVYNEAHTTLNAFSPKFRHNLTCQIANVHQMTGLGMTIGWTMLNMAFNSEFMHTILAWNVPIFPNIPLFFTGLLILVLFFAALLPIPLYFLEIFINLAIDFILLPLTLLGWIFKNWKIFPKGSKNIQQTIDDVVAGALGLAMTGIFITFAIMVLNSVFGNWDGATTLQAALDSNDPKILIQGLMSTTGNKSLVTIILMGIFMAMFMVMIPALIKSLFNVTVSDKYYQSAKKDLDTVWSGVKKLWKSAKK